MGYKNEWYWWYSILGYIWSSLMSRNTSKDSLKQFPSTVKVYLWKVPSIHTARGGEGNTRNSGQLSLFQDPPTRNWRVCLRMWQRISVMHIILYSNARQSKPNVCTLERNEMLDWQGELVCHQIFIPDSQGQLSIIIFWWWWWWWWWWRNYSNKFTVFWAILTNHRSPTKVHMNGFSLERDNWATPHVKST